MTKLNALTYGAACFVGTHGDKLVKGAKALGAGAVFGLALKAISYLKNQSKETVVVEKVVKVVDTDEVNKLKQQLVKATTKLTSAEGVLAAQAKREKNLGIITTQLRIVKAALRVTKAVEKRGFQLRVAKTEGRLVSNNALRNLHRPLQALEMLDTARNDLEAAQAALTNEKNSAKKIPLQLVVNNKHEILAAAIAQVEKNKEITNRFTIGVDGKYHLRTDNAKKIEGAILSGALVVEPGKPKKRKFLGFF